MSKIQVCRRRKVGRLENEKKMKKKCKNCELRKDRGKVGKMRNTSKKERESVSVCVTSRLTVSDGFILFFSSSISSYTYLSTCWLCLSPCTHTHTYTVLQHLTMLLFSSIVFILPYHLLKVTAASWTQAVVCSSSSSGDTDMSSGSTSRGQQDVKCSSRSTRHSSRSEETLEICCSSFRAERTLCMTE